MLFWRNNVACSGNNYKICYNVARLSNNIDCAYPAIMPHIYKAENGHWSRPKINCLLIHFFVDATKGRASEALLTVKIRILANEQAFNYRPGYSHPARHCIIY
jgi:hypothetical protein